MSEDLVPVPSPAHDGNEIAVILMVTGMIEYRNRHSITGRIHVSVFRFCKEEFMGEEMLSTEILPGTKQSFKKRDLRIARWYYKQLCKSFKNGIVVWNGSRKSSHGRWD